MDLWWNAWVAYLLEGYQGWVNFVQNIGWSHFVLVKITIEGDIILEEGLSLMMTTTYILLIVAQYREITVFDK